MNERSVTQISEASDAVRVTSHTDTVRGCQFLVNVNDLTAGELTRGPYTVRQAVLKYNPKGRQAGRPTLSLELSTTTTLSLSRSRCRKWADTAAPLESSR
jgi:hypothetical protein